MSQNDEQAALQAAAVRNAVGLLPQNQRQLPISGDGAADADGVWPPDETANMHTSESVANISFFMGTS